MLSNLCHRAMLKKTEPLLEFVTADDGHRKRDERALLILSSQVTVSMSQTAHLRMQHQRFGIQFSRDWYVLKCTIW